MQATAILKEEHRVIERVLDALETAANRLTTGSPVRPGVFLQAADFIKGFADGCHHKKEEGVLFPALEAAGIPAEGGPIALIRSGDRVTIDAEKNLITVDLSEEELATRRREWRMPPLKATRGTLAKYIRLVKNASLGCVTDE